MSMAKALDWQALERQAAEQLPTLRARLDTATTSRARLALAFRIAVLEDCLERRENG